MDRLGLLLRTETRGPNGQSTETRGPNGQSTEAWGGGEGTWMLSLCKTSFSRLTIWLVRKLTCSFRLLTSCWFVLFTCSNESFW